MTIKIYSMINFMLSGILMHKETYLTATLCSSNIVIIIVQITFFSTFLTSIIFSINMINNIMCVNTDETANFYLLNNFSMYNTFKYVQSKSYNQFMSQC